MSDFAKDTNTMDASWQLYDAERMANERLRQQLENMTERYNVRKELADHLSQQLAELSEINNNHAFNAKHFKCEYEKVSQQLSAAHEASIAELRKQLAASQLQNTQLRSLIDRSFNDHDHKWSDDAIAALALPQDTSALEALIASVKESK